MLRRIFAPTGDEVTGDQRKLHNVKFNNLHSLPNIIRMIKWTGHDKKEMHTKF
jgi:hypothetical protein